MTLEELSEVAQLGARLNREALRTRSAAGMLALALEADEAARRIEAGAGGEGGHARVRLARAFREAGDMFARIATRWSGVTA